MSDLAFSAGGDDGSGKDQSRSARLGGVMREVSPRAHRGAGVIGTDALRIVLISRGPSDGQERNQNNKDDQNINAHQSSNDQK